MKTVIDQTCLQDSLEFFRMVSVIKEAKAQEKQEEKSKVHSHTTAKTRLGKIRQQIDNAFTNPSSSKVGLIYGWVDIACIILSIILMISETDPKIDVMLMDKTSKIPKIWASLELATIIFFTFDVLLRFVVTYEKFEFVKSPGTWLDLFTVLPFFLEVLVDVAQFGSIKILRVARIARILKLIKRNKRLLLMVTVLSRSMGELSMLFIVWGMCIVVAGMSLYFIEETDNSPDVKSGKSYCNLDTI